MKNTDSQEVAVTEAHESEEDRRFVAKYALHPIQHAARAVGRMTLQEDKYLDNFCNELGNLVQAAKTGDMGRLVSMLVAQAHTLEATFYHLLERGTSPFCSTSEIEPYLRPAFKAQSQCRATLETLVTLSNPRSVAIVQANTNIQVNNSTTLAGGSLNAPNKLLEESCGNRMDQRATAPAIESDSSVAALEAIDGAQIRRG